MQQATSGLVERISEIEDGEGELVQLERKLNELTSQLIALPAMDLAKPEEQLASV